MTVLNTPRGRELTDKLRSLAGERLKQTLDAVCHCDADDAPDSLALDHLLTAKLTDIDPRLARDAFERLRDSRPIERPIRLLLLRRVAELRRLLRSRELPELDLDRQARLVNLVCVAAGVFIPLLAGAGEYHRAIGLAAAVQKTVMNKAHRRVLGAGAAGADPRMKYLLLAPVLWSLAAALLADFEEDDDDDHDCDF